MKGFLTDCKYGYRVSNGAHDVCSCMLPYPSGHFADLAHFKRTCIYQDDMEGCPDYRKQQRDYGNEYGQQRRRPL